MSKRWRLPLTNFEQHSLRRHEALSCLAEIDFNIVDTSAASLSLQLLLQRLQSRYTHTLSKAVTTIKEQRRARQFTGELRDRRVHFDFRIDGPRLVRHLLRIALFDLQYAREITQLFLVLLHCTHR